MNDGHPLYITYKWCRRIAIAVVGFTVLCVGVCMIVLPGPAFVVIPAGLGILAIEFAWAKRWLHEAKERGSGLMQAWRNRSRDSQPPGD
jgi:tellurite resistance protein TerC